MGDDWRVTVAFTEAARAGRVASAVRDRRGEYPARGRPGHGVTVSVSGNSLFLYGATEAAVRQAVREVREVLGELQLFADFALDRWHPVAQDWQDASVPMPESSEALAAERQRLMDFQTRESKATGRAGWQVRAELPSRRQAVEFAGLLRAEGRDVIRRRKYLILGADNEDDAAALAEVVRQQAPVDTSVQVAQNALAPDTGQSAEVASMFFYM